MERSENQALILVSGLVQGVYFRVHARQKALALGLSGYAKNLPDGRVEIKVAGQQGEIKKLIAWCYEGSPNSRVDEVQYQWQEPDHTDSGFLVC